MITQSWRPDAAMRLGLLWRLADGLAAMAGTVTTWIDRSRQRNMLRSFDARMLRDIGLTPDAGAREADKPFWRE